jgi:IS30 family transposase
LLQSNERRAFIGHREGDIVIGAANQYAIVTLVGRTCNYAVVNKINRKTSDQAFATIV